MSSPDWISQNFRQPLDRLALVLIGILTVALIALLIAGDHTAPRVRNFSWQQQQVGVDDRGFILMFSRPMNHRSVEENLRIDPSLPGKISWAGRRMAYTLSQPIPYGQQFELQLQGARDLFAKPGEIESLSDPFIGKFCSRDRAFVYLGASAEEQLNQSIEGLEYEFANAIRTLSTDKRKSIGLVLGHNEPDSLNLAGLTGMLLNKYDVFNVDLPSRQKELSTYDAIIFPKPTSRFSEREKYLIDQYIMSGGKALFFVDHPWHFVTQYNLNFLQLA